MFQVYDKKEINFNTWQDFGQVFLYYLPKTSLGFKILQRTHASILSVNYEWTDDIEILVNPPDPYYLNHFIKPWDESICNKFISKQSYGQEVISTLAAMFDIMRSVAKHKLIKGHTDF